jgi:hypothetical protein
LLQIIIKQASKIKNYHKKQINSNKTAKKIYMDFQIVKTIIRGYYPVWADKVRKLRQKSGAISFLGALATGKSQKKRGVT